MSTPMFNRRSFLQTLGSAGAGLAAFGGLGPVARLARADTPASDRYYVFCYFSGGWDILLGLDPRDPAVFHAGQVNTSGIQPAYELLQGIADPNVVTLQEGLTVGPYFGTELAGLKDRICIVRGMSMETLTHEVGRRRFLTGKPPSGLNARGSSGSSWIAWKLGEGEPIPNLSVQVETYNPELDTYATALKVNSVPDLLRALKPGTPLMDPRSVLHLDALLDAQGSCDYAKQSPLWRKADIARKKARQMSQGGWMRFLILQPAHRKWSSCGRTMVWPPTT